MGEWICGRNPVYEVLVAARRPAHRLQVARGSQRKGRLAEILDLCAHRQIRVEMVQRSRLDAFGTGHQGVALYADPYPYRSFPGLLVDLAGRQAPALVLLLDMLQDPQNLGTLLRTAECFGVDGVILPLRRAATITPAVVQASSGASEHLHVAQVNLAQAVVELKELGLWIIGLENHPGARSPDQVDLSVPVGMVVGNEGRGLRRLVRESCDILMAFPSHGRVESLNAAVAGSIGLYLAWQARNPGSETKAKDRP